MSDKVENGLKNKNLTITPEKEYNRAVFNRPAVNAAAKTFKKGGVFMKSYNNVTLVGRAVRSPELKDVGNANARAQFALAVDRPYKDAEGKHPTDFLNVVAWGKLAEICRDYIQKGCLLLLSGRVQARS